MGRAGQALPGGGPDQRVPLGVEHLQVGLREEGPETVPFRQREGAERVGVAAPDGVGLEQGEVSDEGAVTRDHLADAIRRGEFGQVGAQGRGDRGLIPVASATQADR